MVKGFDDYTWGEDAVKATKEVLTKLKDPAHKEVYAPGFRTFKAFITFLYTDDFDPIEAMIEAETDLDRMTPR